MNSVSGVSCKYTYTGAVAYKMLPVKRNVYTKLHKLSSPGSAWSYIRLLLNLHVNGILVELVECWPTWPLAERVGYLTVVLFVFPYNKKKEKVFTTWKVSWDNYARKRNWKKGHKQFLRRCFYQNITRNNILGLCLIQWIASGCKAWWRRTIFLQHCLASVSLGSAFSCNTVAHHMNRDNKFTCKRR